MANVNWRRMTPHECWGLVDSEDEFLLLGYFGIQECLRYWRSVRKEVGLELGRLEALEKIELPRDKWVGIFFPDEPTTAVLAGPLDMLLNRAKNVQSCFSIIRRECEEKIRLLEGLQKRAKQAPVLPPLRPTNWFLLHEEVVVLKNRNSLFSLDARPGRISKEINKYSVEVRWKRQERIITREDPCLMHNWEWILLTNDSQLRDFWLARINPKPIIPPSF